MSNGPPVHLNPFIDRIEATAQSIFGADAKLTATGVALLAFRAVNAISESLMRSYIIALLIITPLMFWILGSLRLGAIAMVPNLAPIILTLGTMGWLGIPLDVFTMLIGSIAIGLAVDDTIHFMHGFRSIYARTGDTLEAIRTTLRTTGHALLVTTLVLCLGFFIFAFANLSNLVTFGLLTGYTILLAFIADVAVGPALLVLSHPDA
jgi:predicted RND superfamily exporter protein